MSGKSARKRLAVSAMAVAAAAFALTGCGGDDSSPPPIAGPTPSPAPSPTPSPTPAPGAQVPSNPFLAASLWPVYHANNYATASVASIGPGTVEQAQIIGALSDLGDDLFVSPWTVLGPVYSDGSQPVITTPNNGVAKYLIKGGRFEAVDFLALERNDFDFDWALLVLRNGNAVVTERKFNRIVVLGDVTAGDPSSRLEVKKRIEVDIDRYGPLLAHHSLAPDGTLIALTQANKLIAVDLDAGTVIASFDFPTTSGASFQNSFPIDENGRIFVAAQSVSVAVDWDGEAFQLAWSAPYDMRGPGCENVPINRTRIEEILAVSRGETCTGTGTTPTLIGRPQSGVFVIVDGHSPRNNLIAFWRVEPPADWQPLADPLRPGQFLDRRIAGILPLPFSTPDGLGFTAQNSPAVLGNSAIIAQWAGFNPRADALRGMQRVDWVPNERRLRLAWANPDILFNGVPLIACVNGANCQTYGAGRYGNAYEYTSLDFETGRETGRVFLGTNDEVLDQGNGHAVADDGSIVYGGKRTMIRIR